MQGCNTTYWKISWWPVLPLDFWQQPPVSFQETESCASFSRKLCPFLWVTPVPPPKTKQLCSGFSSDNIFFPFIFIWHHPIVREMCSNPPHALLFIKHSQVVTASPKYIQWEPSCCPRTPLSHLLWCAGQPLGTYYILSGNTTLCNLITLCKE